MGAGAPADPSFFFSRGLPPYFTTLPGLPLFLLFVYRFPSSLILVTHPLTLASYFPLFVCLFEGFPFASVYKRTAKEQRNVATSISCRDSERRTLCYRHYATNEREFSKNTPHHAARRAVAESCPRSIDKKRLTTCSFCRTIRTTAAYPCG
jgi:hypothetical protein